MRPAGGPRGYPAPDQVTAPRGEGIVLLQGEPGCPCCEVPKDRVISLPGRMRGLVGQAWHLSSVPYPRIDSVLQANCDLMEREDRP